MQKYGLLLLVIEAGLVFVSTLHKYLTMHLYVIVHIITNTKRNVFNSAILLSLEQIMDSFGQFNLFLFPSFKEKPRKNKNKRKMKILFFMTGIHNKIMHLHLHKAD